MIAVQFLEELEQALPPGPLEQAAAAALALAAAEGDLTVVLTGAAQIQALNRDFLGIDAPTDVLSFPSGEVDPDTGALYLGDVILSLPQVQAQAAAAGHPALAEAQLLVVHGVLHLLGYDHGEPEQKAAMWAAQAAILQQIGAEVLDQPRTGLPE